MSSRMMRAASFPKMERANSYTRRIIGSPYDSDSDISFAGHKKCTVARGPNLFQRLSINANELQIYGRRIADHAIQTLVASDTEESDEYDSGDDARRARRARTKAMNIILERAGQCAANLRSVADEVPKACAGNPCLLGYIREEDYSTSDDDDRPKRKPRRRRKKSEAKPHDGSLHSDVSVTTDADAYSTDYYSSIASEEDSDCSDSESSVESARLAKLRRRRKQFLRRRAMEHAAGNDTDNDDESSLHFGGPKLSLGMKKKWKVPSQELRHDKGNLYEIASATVNEETLNKEYEKWNYPGGGEAPMPGLADTTIEESLEDAIREDIAVELNNNDGSKDPEAKDGEDNGCNKTLAVQTHAPQRLSDHNGKEAFPRQLKWQAIEQLIPYLSPPPYPGYSFLDTNHIGPVVIHTPSQSLVEAGLQLGDVIIRLNNENVSKLEGKEVCEMMNKMAGESVRVNFLRKNMLM